MRLSSFCRQAVALLIVFLLISPFIALVSSVSTVNLPLNEDVARVFALTVLQASLSSIGALVFGVLGGLGLLWASLNLGAKSGSRARSQGALESAAILPSAAPVLLLLLAVAKLFPWARGFGGIVFVHALLNSGMIAVAFAHLVRTKISGMAELAYVEGASGWKFFWRGALPVLRVDLIFLFIFVFALCFSSFAVPLALGGSRASTVEVLIYQKIRIGGDWSEAVGLALMQAASVLALSLIVHRAGRSDLAFRSARAPLLSWAPGLIFALAPTVLLGTGLTTGLTSGFRQIVALPELLEELPALVAGSVIVGTCSGFFMVALLLALAFARPGRIFQGFLAGYAAPSSALVGFAILLFWREPGLASYFKISLGVALVAAPSMFRYQWRGVLASLEGQLTVARTLGAGDLLLFSRIILPQVVRPACRIGGITALWAWGDFALSRVIAERPITLAMATQGLMNSYRLDAATVMVWILIAGGVLTFAVFMGAGYVMGPESEA